MAKKTDVVCMVTCRECRHSVDYFNKSLDGKMILCYCDSKYDEDKYAKLLDQEIKCKHYEQRKIYR